MTASQSLNSSKPACPVAHAHRVWIGQLMGGTPAFVQHPVSSDKGIYSGFDSLEALVSALVSPSFSKNIVEIGSSAVPPISSDTKYVFSRDPELWESEFTKLSDEEHVFVLAPIHPVDGYCIDKGFARKLIELVFLHNQKSHVILLDDVSAFSWGAQERPVRFSEIEGEQIHWVNRLKSLGIDESPNVWIRAPHSERTFKSLPGKILQSSDTLLAALFNRELQKGIIYLRRSVQAKRRFRRIGDAVNPYIKKGFLNTSHWPHSGLNFYIQFEDSFIESTQLLEKQAEQLGLLLNWHHKHKAFSINVAVPSKLFSDAPERLSSWLEQIFDNR